MKNRSLADAYFKAWNDHDISQLERVLHKDVKLIDWDLDVHGLSAVLDANAKIFAEHPNIHATPLNIVTAEEKGGGAAGNIAQREQLPFLLWIGLRFLMIASCSSSVQGLLSVVSNPRGSFFWSPVSKHRIRW